METTNLDKFLHTVRRIEEHREEKAVNQLKKLYKRLIKDLQSHLGTVYAKYSDENGLLTYARLHKDALDARLLQEVASKMNDVTQAEKKLITELVEQTYSNVYSGMVQAVDKVVDDRDLVTTFAQVQSAKPQALRAAVNNPVHGLTLSAQLEKNRANIIYGIQQAVGIGLSVGDRYDTMAKRVQKALIGDDGAGGSYAKSMRIVRTEAHRVREQGNQDAAKELHNRLEPEGFVMVKTWHTMKDERVRPNVSRRTKKGWKYSIGNGKYNHVKMEGQSVPVNEPFTLPSGATAMSPGMSGVAGEDINCRCFVSYEVRKIKDYQKGESEQQRYGRNKKTIVNRTYIGSGSYIRKFDKITDNAEVNKVLYHKTKEMLYHRGGTKYEDMYWIDGKTGAIVASALNEKRPSEVVYSASIVKKIKNKKDLITVHNHPSSCPPSLADFNSNFENGYKKGVIACHDGTIYVYSSQEYISQTMYNLHGVKYNSIKDEREMQMRILEDLSKNFKIYFEEVK